MKAALLALCCAIPALADLQLFVTGQTGQNPVGSFYDLGNTPAGDPQETVFRIRNGGLSSASVTTIAVAGTGFDIPSRPALPVALAPGGYVEFTLRFQAEAAGTYSAVVKTDGVQLIVRAVVTPTAAILLDGKQLANGASVDFGRVEIGSAVIKRFVVENRTPQPITPAVTLPKMGFRAAAPESPIAPGGSGEIVVEFAPAVAGPYAGTLQIDSRTFNVTGVGLEIPLPKPQLSIDLDSPASARQGKVTVSFDSPARGSGRGTLRLVFRPSVTGVRDDGSVVFAGGVRTVNLDVQPGASAAASIPFQTGSTAGTIEFTADLGANSDRVSIEIQPAAPAIDSVTASRASGTLDVRIAGWDNVRSLAQAAFTFYDAAGQAISPGAIRADVSADFRKYFADADGGTFLLRAVFPVTGDPAKIAGVEIELSNTSGTAKSARVQFSP